MDEMTQVREPRAGAPVPDRGRLVAGRTRLTESARAGGRHQVLWRRREFVIVAVVAAVTAVAVTVTVLLSGTAPGSRKVEPAGTPNVSLKGLSAAQLLERAADLVEKEPDSAVPRADQWIYTLQMSEAPVAAVTEMPSWIRYDGTATASEDIARKGQRPQLIVTPMHLENGGEGDDRSPREMCRVLTALPAGGEQTVKFLRHKNAIADQKGRTQAQSDYTGISVLLGAHLMTSKGLASLYRALATLPGGEVTDQLVKDAAGRRVIVLTYVRSGALKSGEADQWLFDPQTYRITGTRMLLDGTVVGGSSTAAWAVVDKAGERG
ncbi:CU044_5270 family protein [Streptomyces sp. NBC_01288]|uniref:CU044_5270 family protein n=1 Tax=Streptomyces sp. NBC_01288 TaxID=2903814 RepID=UPI002E0D9888|nr:CU044_5270 family protein [Streptomyces sp. NBC_01288]